MSLHIILENMQINNSTQNIVQVGLDDTSYILFGTKDYETILKEFLKIKGEQYSEFECGINYETVGAGYATVVPNRRKIVFMENPNSPLELETGMIDDLREQIGLDWKVEYNGRQ